MTTAATYLLIVAGGVVRVTGSGLGCGVGDDWPLCHGGLLPPLRQDAVIEFTHRWLAAVSTALVITLVVVAWMRYRQLHRIVRPATMVLALFVVQIILGAATVKLGLPGVVILVHLANALLLLGALAYITVTACTMGRARAQQDDLVRRSGAPWGRHVALTTGAATAIYLLIISGGLVVARGAGYACAAWPLCGDGLQLEAGAQATVNVFHRLLAAVVVVIAALAIMSLRRAAPRDARLRAVGALGAVLLVAQVVAGALVVQLRLPAAARGIHLALASALWVIFVIAALLSRSTTAAPEVGRHHHAGVEPASPRATVL
ncbi:MAG: heme A synthase [Candidatus Dormibacteria bacterium]